MDNGMIIVDWLSVATGLGLAFVAIGLSYFQGFRMERDLIIGVVRAVLQLTILGYVLAYVFLIKSVWYTALILLLMAFAAAVTAKGRIKRPYPGAIPVLWISIAGGSFFAVTYITILTMADPQALTPRYLIPLGGMAIGNVLNGISLAGERFCSELESQRDRIEVLLSLGADSHRAAAESVRAAFTAAMIPTLNMLMVVGLIQIPGIMVGQVLTGTDPLIAARYQLLVLFMIVGGKTLSLTIGLRLAVRKYFTPEHQLRKELL